MKFKKLLAFSYLGVAIPVGLNGITDVSWGMQATKKNNNISLNIIENDTDNNLETMKNALNSGPFNITIKGASEQDLKDLYDGRSELIDSGKCLQVETSNKISDLETKLNKLDAKTDYQLVVNLAQKILDAKGQIYVYLGEITEALKFYLDSAAYSALIGKKNKECPRIKSYKTRSGKDFYMIWKGATAGYTTYTRSETGKLITEIENVPLPQKQKLGAVPLTVDTRTMDDIRNVISGALQGFLNNNMMPALEKQKEEILTGPVGDLNVRLNEVYEQIDALKKQVESGQNNFVPPNPRIPEIKENQDSEMTGFFQNRMKKINNPQEQSSDEEENNENENEDKIPAGPESEARDAMTSFFSNRQHKSQQQQKPKSQTQQRNKKDSQSVGDAMGEFFNQRLQQNH